MSGPGVPDDDMRYSQPPSRGEVPQVGDPAFDALLARTLAPEDAAAGLRPVVEGFDVLYRAPVPADPAAESAALAAFRQAAGLPARHARKHRRRARPVLLRARLAVATAAAVAALGGTAAAAYAGALPAPLQRLAHDTVGAPPAPPALPAPSVTPRPDPATRPPAAAATPQPAAAPGLCAAYARAVVQGNAARKAAAFRKLAAAAGGAAHVAAYCAATATQAHPHPTHPVPPHHGKPTALPAQATATHHGKPTK